MRIRTLLIAGLTVSAAPDVLFAWNDEIGYRMGMLPSLLLAGA